MFKDLVVRSELSIKNGDGVVKLLRCEGPIFLSAMVLGRK